MSAAGATRYGGRWSVWKFNWLAHHKEAAAIERARVHARGVMLDVGCGARPYEPLFAGHVTRVWGTDLKASRDLGAHRPDAYARAEAQPLRAGAVDTVLGLSMLTYLAEPQRMIDEAHRVLSPGGTLILEFTQMAPLYLDYKDYFRFTPHGATELLGRAGFDVVEMLPIGGLWARVGLTTIAGLNRINRGPTRVLTELPVRALYVILQLGFELMDRVFFDPREAMGHLVVARKRVGSGAA